MKRIVWLHIGTHKTASSSIQLSLRTYDDGVRRYARLGSRNHSVAMTLLFDDAPEASPRMKRTGADETQRLAATGEARAALLRELEGPGEELVLSGEGMSGFSAAAFRRAAEFLAPHAAEVRVLVYAREPIGFQSSMFQQQVKASRSRFDLAAPNYRGRIGPAIEVFGRDRVQVAAFDPSAFPEGGIVGDAARRIGLDMGRIKAETTNEGLSPGAVALLYFWNRAAAARDGSPARVRARNRLTEALRGRFPGRFRLSPDLVRAAADMDDLAWLAETAGIDFRPALAAAEPRPGDVGSEEDLARLRDGAVEALRAICREAGAADAGDADDLMTALYRHHLRAEKGRERGGDRRADRPRRQRT